MTINDTTFLPPPHTIRKVNFLYKISISRVFHPNLFFTIFLVKSKLSIATKSKTTTFSRVFHPRKNRQFFSWIQSCQQLKSPKPQHFHEFLTPQKIGNFLGKSKLNFWTKNEDLEQCAPPSSFFFRKKNNTYSTTFDRHDYRTFYMRLHPPFPPFYQKKLKAVIFPS